MKIRQCFLELQLKNVGDFFKTQCTQINNSVYIQYFYCKIITEEPISFDNKLSVMGHCSKIV